MRPNLSNPPWVLGGVKFRMNAKESQVLFRVPCGILRHCQNLYIKGGRFVDARGDLEVIGKIAI